MYKEPRSNTSVKEDASLDPKLDSKVQSTTNQNQNLAPTNDGFRFSPAKGNNLELQDIRRVCPQMSRERSELFNITSKKSAKLRSTIDQISNGGPNGQSNIPYNEDLNLKLPPWRSFRKQSYNVLVRSEEGQLPFFAIYLLRDGGLYSEGRIIFDSLKDSRMY